MIYRIYVIDDYDESERLGDVPSPWDNASTYSEALRIVSDEMVNRGKKPYDWVTEFYIRGEGS